MCGKEEKIIIDEVNVAGCRYINKECAKDFSNCGHICKGTECRYKRFHYKDKQLKRLEQERDKYKHALEEIEAELKDDLTCESRECGCDDYGECLECLKETILNIITEAIGE